jgi:D-serine deaminase-like pyridoxal phosphate-dependent protein
VPELPLGTRLRILPNHACATAAQHDAYHAFSAGSGLERWPRMRGWAAVCQASAG